MKTISRILCAVDLSSESRRALHYAGATAKWYRAHLTVLHVVPEGQPVDIIPVLALPGGATPGLPPADRQRLRELVARFVEREVPADLDLELRLPDGRDAAGEIAYEALTQHSDLIIMGTHARQGFDRWRDGSAAEYIARRATCPVIVVPPGKVAPVAPGDERFDRILCAIDFSETALDALSAALALAEDVDAYLTLLNVAKSDDMDRSHLQHLRQLVPESAAVFCRVETVTAAGTASEEILRVAHERRSNLIVMGGSKRGALDQFLFGSTTREVLQAAPCPVFVQRGD